MSNIAPHSSSKFNPDIHLLRQDLIFAAPGAHLLIKWTKTLQHHKSYHWVQLPSIHNHFLSPVRALQALLASRPLSPSAHHFANNAHPHAQVIDTHIRDALKRSWPIEVFQPKVMGYTLSGVWGQLLHLTTA